MTYSTESQRQGVQSRLQQEVQDFYLSFRLLGQELRAFSQAIAKYVTTVLAPGTEEGDLFAVLSMGVEEDERLKAAARVLDRLGPVIHKKRYSRLKPYLEDSAALHKRTLAEELNALASARLFEVLEEVARSGPAEWPRVYSLLRSRLNERLTLDLIGPGWRPSSSVKAVKVMASFLFPRKDILLTWQILLDSLTPRQSQLVSLLTNGVSREQAAAAMGITRKTVDVMWSEIQKKLAAA